MVDGRRIDVREEVVGGSCVRCDDDLGVSGPISSDERACLGDILDAAHAHVEVEVLPAPIVFRRRLHPCEIRAPREFERFPVAMQGDTGVAESRHHRQQNALSRGPVAQQGLRRIAHPRPAGLRVDADGLRHLHVPHFHEGRLWQFRHRSR